MGFFGPSGGAGDRDRTGTMLSHHGILSPGRLPVPPHRRHTPSGSRFPSRFARNSIPHFCPFVKPFFEKISWHRKYFVRETFLPQKKPYPTRRRRCMLAVILLARGDDTPAGDTIFYFTLLGTFHNRSSIGKNKCYRFAIRPIRLFFQEGL